MFARLRRRAGDAARPGGPQSLGPGGPGGTGAAQRRGPGRSRISAPRAGDRVFFAFDRADISSEAQQILERQAALAAALSECQRHHRGPLRRARHARIQSGSGRAPGAGGQERAGRAGHPGDRAFDDQLWQGAARGAAFRRSVLCAEPPRRHHGELAGLDGGAGARLPLINERGAGLGALFLPKTDPTSFVLDPPTSRSGAVDFNEAYSECSGNRSCRVPVWALRYGRRPGGRAGACLGQDRSAYERLDRLERDLNMLQRQVYRGGPSPSPQTGGMRRSIPKSAWTGSKPRCAS